MVWRCKNSKTYVNVKKKQKKLGRHYTQFFSNKTKVDEVGNIRKT